MINIKYTITIGLLIFGKLVIGQDNFKNRIINATEQHLKKGVVNKGKHSLGIAVSINRFPLFVDENSSFVSAFTGFRNYSKNTTFINNSIFLDYRYNLRKTIFLEGGFKYQNFLSGKDINITSIGLNALVKSQFTAFSAYELDFGVGYKIIVDNSWRLFDVHFGANFAMVDGPKRQLNTLTDNELEISGSNLNGQFLVFSLSESSEIINKFVFAGYYGIAKDICITKNLFINLRYNRYFGKNNIFSKHVFTYEIPQLGIKNSVNGSIKSSGKMYTIGIRWVFN